MIKIFVYPFLLISFGSQGQNSVEINRTKQDLIIEEHVTNCAD